MHDAHQPGWARILLRLALCDLALFALVWLLSLATGRTTQAQYGGALIMAGFIVMATGLFDYLGGPGQQTEDSALPGNLYDSAASLYRHWTHALADPASHAGMAANAFVIGLPPILIGALLRALAR